MFNSAPWLINSINLFRMEHLSSRAQDTRRMRKEYATHAPVGRGIKKLFNLRLDGMRWDGIKMVQTWKAKVQGLPLEV